MGHVKINARFCKEEVRAVGGFGRFMQCPNKVKHDGFCGVHCPCCKAKRAGKRGPTQLERDLQRAKIRRERDDLVDVVLAQARKLAPQVVGCHDLERALQALDEFTQEHE